MSPTSRPEGGGDPVRPRSALLSWIMVVGSLCGLSVLWLVEWWMG
jgi:hypothetical protein